jgi:hypothetical protein
MNEAQKPGTFDAFDRGTPIHVVAFWSRKWQQWLLFPVWGKQLFLNRGDLRDECKD